jgi:hypothetical protein
MRACDKDRLAAGLCIKGCGRPHTPTAQRCAICTAKAAEAVWRARQTVTRAPRGPARTIRPWNFETDPLIESHMRYARSIAYRIAQRYGIADASDLVGDAYYGLTVAGRTYDASYAVPFGAWAKRQVLGAVLTGVRNQFRLTRGEVAEVAA